MKDQKENPTQTIGFWMAIGIGVIGVSIGVALDNIAIGIGVGVGIGAAIGAYQGRRAGGSRKYEDQEDD